MSFEMNWKCKRIKKKKNYMTRATEMLLVLDEIKVAIPHFPCLTLFVILYIVNDIPNFLHCAEKLWFFVELIFQPENIMTFPVQ